MDFKAPPPDHPETIHEIQVAGETRKLGAVAPNSDMAAFFRRYIDSFPVSGPENWRDCDYSFYGPEVRDQQGFAGSANHAVTGAMDLAMRMAGFTPPHLSGTFAYALLNNGRDRGASVGSVLSVFEQVGCCMESECHSGQIYKAEIAPTFHHKAGGYILPRVDKIGAYVLRGYEDVCAALANEHVPVFSLRVGPEIGRPSPTNYVCPLPDTVIGGQAFFAIGMLKTRSGSRLVQVQGSFGLRWGGGGRALLTQAHFDRLVEAYAIVLPKPKDLYNLANGFEKAAIPPEPYQVVFETAPLEVQPDVFEGKYEPKKDVEASNDAIFDRLSSPDNSEKVADAPVYGLKEKVPEESPPPAPATDQAEPMTDEEKEFYEELAREEDQAKG